MPSDADRSSAVDVHPHRDIVEAVLAVDRPGAGRHIVIAAGAGVVVSALLGLSALRLTPPRRSGPEDVPRVALEISLADAIAPTAAPARSLAVRAPGPVAARPRPTAPRASSPTQARLPGPPSAPAAGVLARETPPSAPIDMTGETFLVGSAKGYAGGVTASAGTSPIPGQGRGLSAGTASGGPATGNGAASPGASRSASVGLASESWSCPWPSEADPLPIDEETVVIRVVVRPDGTAEAVAVVTDPGHGFGQAAANCAMRTPFAPARTAGGEPVRATSAPIRVRFTR